MSLRISRDNMIVEDPFKLDQMEIRYKEISIG